MSQLFEIRHLLEIIKKKNISILQVIELVEKNFSNKLTLNSNLNLNVDYGQDLKETVNLLKISSNVNVEVFYSSLLPGDCNRNSICIVRLFSFPNACYETDYIISEMRKFGFVPAGIFELLAIYNFYLELPKKFPIIALGSVACNSINEVIVPVLDCFNEKVVLDIDYMNGGEWDQECVFLGVKI